LGEAFIKQLLKYFVSDNKGYIQERGLSLFDFEIFNYGNVEIRREWNNIDILLILKEENKDIVIVIENKITSSEHSNQLQRYKKIIDDEFKQHIKIFIYLTPEEATPSDEEWINFNYNTVSKLLDSLLDSKKDSMNDNVYQFIKQYNVILRRYIVGNSEVEQICRQIYIKHARALDLIFQYKPDIALEVSEYVLELLKNERDIIVDSAGKTVIRFTTPIFDDCISKVSEGWSASKRIVLFEFSNSDKLALRLYIGPGEQNYRIKLHECFKQNTNVFKLASKNLGQKWLAVYQKEFLRKKDFEDATIDDLKILIDKHWAEFINTDLLEINNFIKTKWV
jgi:hypothetical protein